MRPAITLALNWPASFGRLVVIPALPTFYQIYHEITLEIGIGDRMIDLVQEGVDCVVRVGELSDSTLVAHPLPPLRQVTCGSTDYVARYCLPSKLEQLEGQRCVDYLSATTGKLQPLEFCVHGQVLLRTLPASLAVNNGESYVAACEANFGLVQAPYYHVARQLEHGSLIEVLPQHRPPDLPITILYPHHRRLTPRLRVFIDWLDAQCRNPNI